MKFSLYILRHAKSDWSNTTMGDFYRPLNKRGQKDAKRISRWMLRKNYIPQQIISSSAIRAKETTSLIVAELGNKKLNNILYEKDLYLAEMNKLLSLIKVYKNGLNSLMLVAHNPGLEHLVRHLSDKKIDVDLNKKILTTANLVIFNYPDSSFNPVTDKGRLVAFIRPKELETSV